YRSAEGNHPSSRRRFQFGLRSLLFSVFVVAVVLWIAMPVQRNYQRQLAMSHLAAIRAGIHFDEDQAGTWIEALLGSPVDRKWHASVGNLALQENADDGDLAFLEYLPELRGLSLRCPQVTDDGLM